MATVTVTGASFDEAIQGNDIVLVDFWAAWCGPCRMFAPVFEKASQAHPDIVFSSIPTLMAFREGILLYAQPGALPAPSLEQLIAAVRGADMAQVHAQVAKEEAAAAAGAGQGGRR